MAAPCDDYPLLIMMKYYCVHAVLDHQEMEVGVKP